MRELTPYELGLEAGKTEFETHEVSAVPDFNTKEEKDQWERGQARGFRLAAKEAQHA